MLLHIRHRVSRRRQLALRLLRFAIVISNRLEVLEKRVVELESVVPKNATKRSSRLARRKTKWRHALGTPAADSPLGAMLGNRLMADRRHCQELIRRTSGVLRYCLRGRNCT